MSVLVICQCKKQIPLTEIIWMSGIPYCKKCAPRLIDDTSDGPHARMNMDPERRAKIKKWYDEIIQPRIESGEISELHYSDDELISSKVQRMLYPSQIDPEDLERGEPAELDKARKRIEELEDELAATKKKLGEQDDVLASLSPFLED